MIKKYLQRFNLVEFLSFFQVWIASILIASSLYVPIILMKQDANSFWLSYATFGTSFVVFYYGLYLIGRYWDDVKQFYKERNGGNDD